MGNSEASIPYHIVPMWHYIETIYCDMHCCWVNWFMKVYASFLQGPISRMGSHNSLHRLLTSPCLNEEIPRGILLIIMSNQFTGKLAKGCIRLNCSHVTQPFTKEKQFAIKMSIKNVDSTSNHG